VGDADVLRLNKESLNFEEGGLLMSRVGHKHINLKGDEIAKKDLDGMIILWRGKWK